ncbi:MAG: hypothetical protein ACOVPA_15780 [Rubrivivax sp.]
MKNLIILFFVAFLSACSSSPSKKSLVSNLSAENLCREYVLSIYRASNFKDSIIIDELINRGIFVGDCNKSEFAAYLKENMPRVLPGPTGYANDSATEIAKLKKDIKKLKDETGRLNIERIIDKNQKPIETMQEWRDRRDKRLRFND